MGRGGTEFIVYTNQAPGQIYYVGVKSEDQEGAQYGFVVVATTNSFGQHDGNGNAVLTPLTGYPAVIPDGSPGLPEGTNVLFLTIDTDIARRVVMTNWVAHQNFGDLLGTLTHNGTSVVLNNHTFFDQNLEFTDPYGLPSEVFVYDDSREGTIMGPTNSPVISPLTGGTLIARAIGRGNGRTRKPPKTSWERR